MYQISENMALHRLDRPSSGRKNRLKIVYTAHNNSQESTGFKTSIAESVQSQIHEKHIHNDHYSVSACYSTVIKMFLSKNK